VLAHLLAGRLTRAVDEIDDTNDLIRRQLAQQGQADIAMAIEVGERQTMMNISLWSRTSPCSAYQAARRT